MDKEGPVMDKIVPEPEATSSKGVRTGGRKLGTRVSQAQQKVLTEYLADHPNLRKGKFSPGFTHKMAMKMWQELAQDLNAIPGACKTANQWKRCWYDLKKIAKRKVSEEKKYRSGTGGGPPQISVLTESELAVSQLLTEVETTGNPLVLEVGIPLEESLHSESFDTQQEIQIAKEIETEMGIEKKKEKGIDKEREKKAEKDKDKVEPSTSAQSRKRKHPSETSNYQERMIRAAEDQVKATQDQVKATQACNEVFKDVVSQLNILNENFDKFFNKNNIK